MQWNDWLTYLDGLTDGAPEAQIAKKAGMERSTLGRQLKRKSVPVQTVMSICRAYYGDILEAFVAVGYITQGEAEGVCAKVGLGHVTDRQLAEEIVRRLTDRREHDDLTEPITVIDEETVILSPPKDEEAGHQSPRKPLDR